MFAAVRFPFSNLTSNSILYRVMTSVRRKVGSKSIVIEKSPLNSCANSAMRTCARG